MSDTIEKIKCVSNVLSVLKKVWIILNSLLPLSFNQQKSLTFL